MQWLPWKHFHFIFHSNRCHTEFYFYMSSYIIIMKRYAKFHQNPRLSLCHVLHDFYIDCYKISWNLKLSFHIYIQYIKCVKLNVIPSKNAALANSSFNNMIYYNKIDTYSVLDTENSENCFSVILTQFIGQITKDPQQTCRHVDFLGMPLNVSTLRVI
jgi:hypothetical protein